MKFFAWTVLIAVLLCALLVWPTLYHYEKLKVGYSEVLIKTNRLTGDSWRLGPTGGWTAVPSEKKKKPAAPVVQASEENEVQPAPSTQQQPLRTNEPTNPAKSQPRREVQPADGELSPSQIDLLSGNVHVNYRADEISVELYNGNDDVSVYEIVIEAPTDYGSDGWERYRRFRFRGDACPPNETRRYVQRTLDLHTTGRFPFEQGLVRIESAKGRR
jgi:hypothetical protein